MKTFWKVFLVSSIFFIVAILLGSYSYLRLNEDKIHSNIGGGKYIEKENMKEEKLKEKTYTSLKGAFEDNSRVNFILLGMEDIRTDTIIFASLEPTKKKVDLISIPRDTYIHRKGYNKGEQRKINAVYGDNGIRGVKKAVSHILEEVPIHHYVMIDYKGVENIIDSIGGVEVMVPFHMKYKDPTSMPPLNIDIKEGRQVLDGKKSLDFLRYRKGNNNKGGYIDGDLGRIEAQQQFLKSFINKALSYRLPVVIRKSFEYVETDLKLMEGLAYATNIIGIKSEDFSFVTLPGEGEFRRFDDKLLSYFTHNPLETKKIIENLYKITP